MPLQSVTLEVSDGTDTGFLSSALFELGAVSVSTTDLHRDTAKEQPLYGEPPQTITPSRPDPAKPWINARITALFPLSSHPDDLVTTIASSLELHKTPTLRLHTEPFDDRPAADWVTAAQAFLKPVHLGTAAIVFPWHDAIPGVINVVLEPGLAFGTGEHATTQLCARWLLSVVRPGVDVLDFGCGSGVLAILAVMVADNTRAVGVDIDPDAVRVANGNAKRNCVTDQVEFCGNDKEPQRTYDLVVANILARPLVQLAKMLVVRLRIGGRIALSGVLVEQAEMVSNAYRQCGVEMEEAAVESGWALLVGVKR